jgi:hypothetical protein
MNSDKIYKVMIAYFGICDKLNHRLGGTHYNNISSAHDR